MCIKLGISKKYALSPRGELNGVDDVLIIYGWVREIDPLVLMLLGFDDLDDM